jgi:hypothetical protein
LKLAVVGAADVEMDAGDAYGGLGTAKTAPTSLDRRKWPFVTEDGTATGATVTPPPLTEATGEGSLKTLSLDSDFMTPPPGDADCWKRKKVNFFIFHYYL